MSDEHEHASHTSPPPTPSIPPGYVAHPPAQPQLVHSHYGVAYVYPRPIMFTPNASIVKIAPTYDPYPEYCPRCRVVAITRREWEFGICACILLIGILCMPFLWPLLILMCTHVLKDAYHYCPFCFSLLAIKKR